MTDTFADLLREVGISDEPARRSSVQLASELPRPRRPMPRVMRPQAGPTRAQTTYGGQQGDVSRMHGFHTDEARDRWLHGSTFADRLRGGATLAAETLGLPSVMAEAEALGRRDWASAGQEAPAAAMTAVGPALGLFGRRAPVAPPNQQIPQLPPAGQFTRRPPPAGRRVAYHGTPHEFESFDSAHIGSGEGAQAFGPGLYVAEEPQVARAYREALSRPGEGRVLEVDIPDGPFIDTDMQFGRLPRQAREAMAEIYGMPESKIPRTASVRVLNAEEASRLRERGYRGIQYLDQGSRGAGKGTRNYVIFNDADLNIRGYERAPRAPSEPVTRLPVNPTRIPTRASDGSVLPAREPQPFRRTEARSDDLRDAARMRPRESDAGSGARSDGAQPDGGSARGFTFEGQPGDEVRYDFSVGGSLDIERNGLVTLYGKDGRNFTDGASGSGADAIALFRPAFRALQQDMATGTRGTYRLVPGSNRLLEFYQTMLAQHPPAGFDVRIVPRGNAIPEIQLTRRGPQRPPANPRPDSTLSGSAGGFAIPPVVRRDFQRLAGGRPSPAPSQRALQGPGGRMTAMSRVGAPEMQTPGPRVGMLEDKRPAVRAQRASEGATGLGLGLLGALPAGTATAALVTQNAEENAVIDRMAALQRENKRRFEELRSRRGPRPYTNPGRLDMNRVVYPFDLYAPNPGYAINPATGRPLPAPR